MTRWLLALLFAFGTVTFLTGCPAEEETTTDDVIDEVEDKAGDVVDEVEDKAGDVEDAVTGE